MGRERTYSSENDSHFSHQSVEADFDNYGGWRTRRALPREYFIEIMVVADSKMMEYHGDGLVSYILVLMNMVRNLQDEAEYYKLFYKLGLLKITWTIKNKNEKIILLKMKYW